MGKQRDKILKKMSEVQEKKVALKSLEGEEVTIRAFDNRDRMTFSGIAKGLDSGDKEITDDVVKMIIKYTYDDEGNKLFDEADLDFLLNENNGICDEIGAKIIGYYLESLMAEVEEVEEAKKK